MDGQTGFVLAAAGMVAAALGLVLPALGRRAAGSGQAVATAAIVTRAGAAPPPGSRLSVLIAAVLPLAALALYAVLGDFAALSATRARATAQLSAPAGLEIADDAVYGEIERHLQRQPGDARAWVLKARLDLQVQRFDAAAQAYKTALGNPASKATKDPGVWLEYAEALGLQQGGTLLGEPARLVAKALAMAPDDPKALDLAGSAAWEQRDYPQAALHWRQLQAQLPPGSERHRQLADAISRADRQAGLALPPRR